MAAYYNEHDPFAAAWLRELIADNLIAPGEVDERSIEDVTPDDLRPFRQCHFFAGIGVWSLAARLAGIDDDTPLWSGSCPCQPFSAAGKGGGFADERHLWPAFHYLIEQSAPVLIVGEQVAGADGDTWLDLVSADMEATGYAFGAAETVACGFGAPHKRSRNYWMGVPSSGGREWLGNQSTHVEPMPASAQPSGLAHELDDGRGQHRRCMDRASKAGQGQSGQRKRLRTDLANDGTIGGLDNAERIGRPQGWDNHAEYDGLKLGSSGPRGSGHNRRPGPVNGFWRDADWLRCRDERWRPVEPGTFPLVDAGSFRNRVGLLRGAGNAITIGQAVGWLQVVMQVII